MVWIPTGRFVMGSPPNEDPRSNDEGPQTLLGIAGFFMGKYEVTQAQYRAIMGTNPSNFKGANNPVEQVSWNDAMEFSRKLSEKTGKNYTLPTEAQWEYACRAGTNTAYSFGNDANQLGNYAWFGSNSNQTTHPVVRSSLMLGGFMTCTAIYGNGACHFTNRIHIVRRMGETILPIPQVLGCCAAVPGAMVR